MSRTVNIEVLMNMPGHFKAQREKDSKQIVRQAELTAKLDIKEDNRLALAWLGDRNLVRRHPESGLSDFEDALLT